MTLFVNAYFLLDIGSGIGYLFFGFHCFRGVVFFGFWHVMQTVLVSECSNSVFIRNDKSLLELFFFHIVGLKLLS